MNIFGINGGELLVLVVLALLLLGPEKIPEYLRVLREWIHKARKLAEGAKEQFKEETGTDFDEVDWQKYDPRQYDPRRVIREALSEPIEDLEASLKDVKDTVTDATDTVTTVPIDRPALTQAQIMAAAVPIDQLQHETQFPDPSRPEPTLETALPDPLDTTAAPVVEQAAQDSAPAVAAPVVSAPAEDVPVVVGTPFDSEAT